MPCNSFGEGGRRGIYVWRFVTSLPDFSSKRWWGMSFKETQEKGYMKETDAIVGALCAYAAFVFVFFISVTQYSVEERCSRETERVPGLPPRPSARPSLEACTWRCPTPEAWSWSWTSSCCPRRRPSRWRRKNAFLWKRVSSCQGQRGASSANM